MKGDPREFVAGGMDAGGPEGIDGMGELDRRDGWAFGPHDPGGICCGVGG